MTKTSLLLLGGGKRLSLLDRFQIAANQFGTKLLCYAYEIDSKQPITEKAKVITGKLWADENVKSDIKSVVVENEIDLIISNVDPATIIQSHLRSQLNSASFCSSLESTERCLSKRLFQEFCEENNLGIIPSAADSTFPIFAKPNVGSASKGVKLITSSAELELLGNDGGYVFQKYIIGTEYTVDAYITRNEKICGVSTRVRTETFAGESIITETIDDPEIQNKSIEAIQKLKLIGPITLQFIREEKSNVLYLMEVNPRFGGGVIASVEAGFNFPLMMLQELYDEEPDTVFYGKKLIMKRYFREVFFEAYN